MHRCERIFVAIGQARRSKRDGSVVCFADVCMRRSMLADERYGERLAFRAHSAVCGPALSLRYRPPEPELALPPVWVSILVLLLLADGD